MRSFAGLLRGVGGDAGRKGTGHLARAGGQVRRRGPQGPPHGLERPGPCTFSSGSRWVGRRGVLLRPLLLPGAREATRPDRGFRLRWDFLRGGGAGEPYSGAVSPGEEKPRGPKPLRELPSLGTYSLMRFTVYPAIDLRGGRCVRLKQGDFDREREYDADPVERAREWERRGARAIHVVDLDGAKEGRLVQINLVREIVNSVSVPLQVGGGVRALEDLRALREAGATRVVMGTAAVLDRELRLRAVEEVDDALVVAVDARDGIVATHGWQRRSGRDVLDLARELAEDGVRSVLYTDVTRDGMDAGPALESTAAVAEMLLTIASGGVRGTEDVVALAKIPGIVGAVVGPARPRPFLFRGVSRYYRVNLRARRPPPTSRAPAPSARSAGVLIPPDGGSALAPGAGAGGAGAGAGGGGGAAFGGGGGGGGSHGALATPPPALETMYPSLHSASAVAPPALASLALASAPTAGSSWARAGEAASRATATIAASNINFFISSAPLFVCTREGLQDLTRQTLTLSFVFPSSTAVQSTVWCAGGRFTTSDPRRFVLR